MQGGIDFIPRCAMVANGAPMARPATRQLDYAGVPAWHRRKVFRRVTVAGVLAVAAVVSLKWAEPAWHHARLLHYQGRCARAWKLGGQQVFSGKTPTALVASEDWDQFYALLSPPGKKQSAATFVHELRRKDGERRLVAVEMPPWPSNAFKGKSPLLLLDATVVAPGGFWSRPRVLASYRWSTWLTDGTSVADDSLQLYGGVPDPNDPTHFTIAFTYAQRQHTIDGWLKNDDSVLLELRGR
jgi:hypothetical protein